MKPILFNTEMVRLSWTGLMTVMRKIVKDNVLEHLEFDTDGSVIGVYDQYDGYVKPVMDYAPYRPGDILYVLETWFKNENPISCDFGKYEYKADYGGTLCCDLITWKSPAGMPKDAARLFLRVTDVRMEQLQDITIDECIKKGCFGVSCDCANNFIAGGAICCVDCMNTGWQESPVVEFLEFWNRSIKKADLPRYGWDANPWVWVIEFERISKEMALKGGGNTDA